MVQNKLGKKIIGAALSMTMMVTAIPAMSSLACERDYRHHPQAPVAPHVQRDNRIDAAALADRYIEVANFYYENEAKLPENVIAVCQQTLCDISMLFRNTHISHRNLERAAEALEDLYITVEYFANEADTATAERDAALQNLCDVLNEMFDFECTFYDELEAVVDIDDFNTWIAFGTEVYLNNDGYSAQDINDLSDALNRLYMAAIEAIDSASQPEEIAPDYGMDLDEDTLPEERPLVIYGEQPEDMDLSEVDLIVQDRCPTLPEERPLVIYGEQPEDMDLSEVDLIVQDRCPTLPEERPLVIYGEQPEDMDLSEVDLLVQDRCPTADATPDVEVPQDEQTSDFEITTTDSFTIDAQEEPVAAEPETVEPETVEPTVVEIVVNVNVTETAPSTQTTTESAPAAPAASTSTSTSSAPAASSAPASMVAGVARVNSREAMVNDLVERLYMNALNRKSDATGKAYWTNMILAGNVDRVIVGFLNSAEFNARNLTDEQFVVTLYSVILNRVPSAEEKTLWVNALANGTSRRDIINGFINSSEFDATCEAYEL